MDVKATDRLGVESTHRVHVLWPDCDPAGIVFYGNYYRWMDDATHYLFLKIGIPFDVMKQKYGTPGVPLVSSHADYRRPAAFRDTLAIQSFFSQCGRSSFTVAHTFRRGEDVILEGWEKRVWCRVDPADPTRIEAVPIPAEVRRAMGF